MKRIFTVAIILVLVCSLCPEAFADAPYPAGTIKVFMGTVGDRVTGNIDGKEVECFLLSTDDTTVAVTSELNLFKAKYPEVVGNIKSVWNGHAFPAVGESIMLFCVCNGELGETGYTLFCYGNPNYIVPDKRKDVISKQPTVGETNALRKAKQYLDMMSFSYNGIIQQLEYEGFNKDEAAYAADNCGADWNKQAVKKAEQYLNLMGFSRDRLIEQLQYEGFTYEQAIYGADANGY